METKGRRGGRGSRISQVTFVAAVSQKPGGEAERHVMEWSVQEASRGCRRRQGEVGMWQGGGRDTAGLKQGGGKDKDI